MSDHLRVIGRWTAGGSLILSARSGEHPQRFVEEERVTIKQMEMAGNDPKKIDRLIVKAIIKVIRRIASSMERFV